MYERAEFGETRLEVLHGLIRSYPFATLVDSEIVVNHIPFLLHTGTGGYGTLAGHVARANDVWQRLPADSDSIVVFQGPQAYITPSWYPSKREHGRVVPTWNYAVVHAYGRPRAVDDKEWVLGHLKELTNVHETGRPEPWQVTDAPEDYIDGMLNGIVGIEMPISKIVGKWKVSQNRPSGDRKGVVAGLESRGDQHSKEMAELVKRYLEEG